MARAKRSNFERRIAKSLTDRGITYAYEACSFVYWKKPYKPTCFSCGSDDVYSEHLYTPDFWLPDYGFYLETKGKFTPTDRKKMQLVRRDNPEVDIRMVFMTDNKLTKKSKKRYSDWADDNGYKYSIGDIDDEWFEEG